MKLFKFTEGPVDIHGGQTINGVDSVMWIERYRDPGEFEIVAPLSSGLIEFLPINTFISHDNTYDVMVVENHAVSEEEGTDPILTITGRSLETIFENRLIGMNLAVSSPVVTDFILASAKTWAQAVTLLNSVAVSPADPDDELPFFEAITDLTTEPGVTEARTLDRDTIHKALVDILKIEDLGVRVLRPNPFGMGSATHTSFYIHGGADKSDTVNFSWKGGDLASGEYLWSGKEEKNAALVVGRYIWHRVEGSSTEFDRRWMIVDANDIDGSYTEVPTGGTLTAVQAAMAVRGAQALASQRRINLATTDISDLSQYQYRRDYEIGDIVSITANFGEMGKMRVVEYAESYDAEGVRGYPTLSIPGET